MVGGIRIIFNGVRGSTPCAGPEYTHFGGHSASVAVENEEAPPLLLDLGTGLRKYADRCADVFHGAVLLSHLHWDHVQGLPFFTPLHREGASLDVYGPAQDGGSLGEVFAEMMRPPFFPIVPGQLTGDVRFHDTAEDDFPIGGAKVRSRWVRHVGPTLGFRVEIGGVSIAYVPDHGPAQSRRGDDDYIPHEVLELCDGVDILIHDAQHTPAEFEAKRHWGHCTAEYAVEVAREAGARRIVLFHHDPAHGDDDLVAIEHCTADYAARIGGPEVTAAYEGLEIEVAAGSAGIGMSSSHRQVLAPDAAALRTVLGHFATGIAIVTALDGDEPVGMACNSFTSVSLEPQLVLFCAAKSSSTWPRIQAAGKWAANILDEDGEEVCRLFAQKGADRFAHINYTPGRTGAPDPRRRARVRRLRDGRRARCRRPRHRRRSGPRARLLARRASRCSSTAAATGASTSRAGLPGRRPAPPARPLGYPAAEPLGDVDPGGRGHDRDHGLGERRGSSRRRRRPG